METLAVHGGERRPGSEGSVVYPSYQRTVYSVERGTGYHKVPYVRPNSTPSQRYLQDKLGVLEGAQAAVATASGMAAVTTTRSASPQSGDYLPASDCLYAETTHGVTPSHRSTAEETCARLGCSRAARSASVQASARIRSARR